ncbi:MAG: hypothetical protein RL662_2365 [Bacteroidota bacterium]|jgi:hypothetical protein
MKKTIKKPTVYLYEIWWTGNGGIPCQSEYCAFDYKPDADDIEQECINTFGSPNDFPEGWRGFKHKKLKLQDVKVLIDRNHKATRKAIKAEQKHRDSENLLNFYIDNPVLKKARGQ